MLARAASVERPCKALVRGRPGLGIRVRK
jgi:hypothetical protein